MYTRIPETKDTDCNFLFLMTCHRTSHHHIVRQTHHFSLDATVAAGRAIILFTTRRRMASGRWRQRPRRSSFNYCDPIPENHQCRQQRTRRTRRCDTSAVGQLCGVLSHAACISNIMINVNDVFVLIARAHSLRVRLTATYCGNRSLHAALQWRLLSALNWIWLSTVLTVSLWASCIEPCFRKACLRGWA